MLHFCSKKPFFNSRQNIIIDRNKGLTLSKIVAICHSCENFKAIFYSKCTFFFQILGRIFSPSQEGGGTGEVDEGGFKQRGSDGEDSHKLDRTARGQGEYFVEYL